MRDRGHSAGTARRLLMRSAAVVVLLGVGFATYYLGLADQGGIVKADMVRVRTEDAPLMDALSEILLVLDKVDPGVSDPARECVAEGVVEAVFLVGERIFVVDHPLWHKGPRVAWYGPDGTQGGEYLAPPGSTLFGPAEPGFAYVVAKQGGPSESVTVVDIDASTESTFTIPLGVNSGGLEWIDGDLYASAQSSQLDLKTMDVEFTEVLVPVAIEGRQVTKAEADDGVLEAWAHGGDAGPFARRRVSNTGVGADVVQTIERVEDGAVLEIPRDAQPMGIDPDGRLMFMMPSRGLDSDRRAMSGWLTSFEPVVEVFCVGLDGQVVSSFIVPAAKAPYPSATASLTSAGDLLVAVAQADDELRVMRYRAVAR